MKKWLAIAILFSAMVLLRAQDQNSAQYNTQFNKAENIFNGVTTDASDSEALSIYTQILHDLPDNALNAVIRYRCYERSGILKLGLDYTLEQSLQDFYSALYIFHKYKVDTAELFRLMLSVGNIHYNQANYDSAVWYFSQAEYIIQQEPTAGFAEDLYNSFGALYSEAGDYKQSSNYFKKALEITKATRPEMHEAIFAMSSNLANSFRMGGQPDSALHLYKKLLAEGNLNTSLYNNVARLYLQKKMPDSALYFLQQVQVPQEAFTIAYNNTAGLAWLQKNDTVKALSYFTKAADFFHDKAPSEHSSQYAATCKYMGDLMVLENKFSQALPYYQESIIQYDYRFSDTSAAQNPGNFIGAFTNYGLFDAMIAKADCFSSLYSLQHDEKYFRSALNTYDSSFAFSDYIKQSIDNDESRQFITDKVLDAYKKAVAFLITAYKENADENLLKQAITWISKSRSASLSISLKENAIKKFTGLPDSLLQKEKNLKLLISRYKLQLERSMDNATIQSDLSEITDAELQLSRLTNSYRNYAGYSRKKFSQDTIDINQIQKNVLADNMAILCYFRDAQALRGYVVTKSGIRFSDLDGDSSLVNDVNNYTQQLQLVNEFPNQADTLAKNIYKALVYPLQNELSSSQQLVIIPDKDFTNLPFESLVENDNSFLVEKFAITYQYTPALLKAETAGNNSTEAVGFAPFSSSPNGGFASLPQSRDEVSAASQERFFDSAATKNAFLAKASKAGIIHLATHAGVDFQNPENSYIQFYNRGDSNVSAKLFAHELYNLDMPQVKLVFLSACETGNGKISGSEGALSLSRAFAAAGCSNIITSLWKAEDNSTAYICKKFYSYVNTGYTYAEALQKAKTDLLKDPAMSQFHSPKYWSHLILIGDVAAGKSSSYWWLYISAVIIVVTTVIVFIRKRKPAKR